jgi:hypothetical protein
LSFASRSDNGLDAGRQGNPPGLLIQINFHGHATHRFLPGRSENSPCSNASVYSTVWTGTCPIWSRQIGIELETQERGMKKSTKSLIQLPLAMVVIGLLAAGCSQRLAMSGGGSMASTGPSTKYLKANLGFDANNCYGDINDVTGTFNYHDKGASSFEPKNGVMMTGTVVAQNPYGNDCDVFGNGDSALVLIDYVSTNPRLSGHGDAVACVWDTGEGRNPHGYAWIEVTSGPYDGYTNYGEVKGNIQSESCPE